MNKQPVSYLQTDPRWGNLSYSAAGERTTIGASGCGPTAMAMVLATWADPAVTPLTECRWALAHGYKAPHQGTYYGYFVPAAKRYGLKCERLNTAKIYGNSQSPYHATAKAAIFRGDLVIACMGKGNWTRSGHYVLVWKIDGNTIYINDPASSKPARTRGDYALFRQQVKYYWVICCPKGKEEAPDMTEAETRKIVQEELSKQAATITDQVVAALSEPTYGSVEEAPGWAQTTIQKLVDKGALQGDGTGLDLTYSLIRALVVLDRMGAFD